MTTSSAKPARRGPKPMLSRAAVLEAALDLVDASGLAALNLRALATRLGVSAMTPYSHFSDKAELLSAMVGHALAPLSNETAGASRWDEAITGAMHSLHHTLERHPGVVELLIVEPDAQRLDDFRQQLIAILCDEGLTRSRAADVLRTLTSYIFGYTMLNRLHRGSPHESFDAGLAMVMESLCREVAALPGP
jgi:AcrR family transcriptional regulator